MKHKYSIVTVTYNCVSTIERTIKSVIEQNYSEIEYVVIDGGSKDGTLEIIKKYSEKISIIVSEHDNGIFDAMNKGIRYSTGDVISFINGDDYYIDRYVIDNVEKRFQESEADIIAGRVIERNKPSNIIRSENLDKLYEHMLFCHQGIFAARRVFENNGLFDTQYVLAADYEWLMRAYTNNYIINPVSDIYVWYSVDGRSSDCYGMLEACSISVKYLRSTGRDEKIDIAKQRYINDLENSALKKRLSDDNSLDWLPDKDVSIWGCGVWGNRISKYLRKHGIKIKSYIDINPQLAGTMIDGVMVKMYDKANVEPPIIIATSIYDKEISQMLQNDGFEDKIDYYTLSDINSKMDYSGMRESEYIHLIEKM